MSPRKRTRKPVFLPQRKFQERDSVVCLHRDIDHGGFPFALFFSLSSSLSLFLLLPPFPSTPPSHPSLSPLFSFPPPFSSPLPFSLPVFSTPFSPLSFLCPFRLVSSLLLPALSAPNSLVCVKEGGCETSVLGKT